MLTHTHNTESDVVKKVTSPIPWFWSGLEHYQSWGGYILRISHTVVLVNQTNALVNHTSIHVY